MTRIPDALLQELRDRVDIVGLVGETVQLRRQGRNFVGLCPFHREKTPSFNVNPELQIFKCFGCGAGGNVITYLMTREGLSFPEAARQLAGRAGLELPAAGGDPRPLWQPLYEANAFAAELYARTLRESPEAETARAYLAERDVGEPARETFRLGWAPVAWDTLLGAARSAGVADQALLAAGLVSRSERTGGLFDRFRGRVVFPILDTGGRTVGFSGRRIVEDDSPKYLNSPESPIFRKGALLFGLALTKNAVRRADEAVVVEGNFDLVSLQTRGLANVVAPLGTSLTTDQAGLLKRYTARAVLLFDSDEAGLKAAFRSGDELLAAGFTVRLASLPKATDPDAFVRGEGPEALRALLAEAPELVAAKLRVLRDRLDLSRVDARRLAIERLLRSVRRIPDPITRELQMAFVAEELGVDPQLIRQAERRKSQRAEPARAGAADSQRPPAPGVPAAERLLLAVFLRRPDLVVRFRDQVVPEDFTATPARQLYELILDEDPAAGASDAGRALLDRSQPDVQAVLSEILLMEEEKLQPHEAVLRDALRWMKEDAKARELAELLSEVRRQTATADPLWSVAHERVGLHDERGEPS